MTPMQDKEGTDPNRVGGPTNPLLEGGGLSTIIGKGRDGDNSFALNRLHTRRCEVLSLSVCVCVFLLFRGKFEKELC
jgi:hypothetical protein